MLRTCLKMFKFSKICVGLDGKNSFMYIHITQNEKSQRRS